MQDNIFGIHSTAANLRAQRAGVLASNLANADTPGYKARDLDFAEALASADRVAVKRTRPGHLFSSGGPDAAALLYRQPLQPSLDGNTVDTHVENGEFAQNALQYQTSVFFIDSRVKGLMKALRGE